VQTNGDDYIDAEAIAEAVQRPRMRFAPIKTEEQLDLQSLHWVRQRWVMRRTAVVNRIRSLLLAGCGKKPNIVQRRIAECVQWGMRGTDQQQSHVFSYISPEQRVRKDHPLRPIRTMADEILKQLSPQFDKMCAKVGWPSIPPVQLLRAQHGAGNHRDIGSVSIDTEREAESQSVAGAGVHLTAGWRAPQMPEEEILCGLFK
jgi:hypothetical protein